MQNFAFKSIYDFMPRELTDTIGPTKFYNGFRDLAMEHREEGKLPALLAGQPDVLHNRALAELTWYECGKPFYRISNDIIALFSDVNLDIPFEFIRFPYDTFILLLETSNPLRGAHHRQLRSILVETSVTQEGDPIMALWCDLGEHEEIPPHLPVLNYIFMQAEPDKLVANAIRELPMATVGSDLRENDLDMTAVRLAISVCFLATSSDKLIRPDVLSNDLSKWLRAAREGNEPQMDVIVNRARRRKGLGYVVSLERERQLLHAIGKGGGTGEGHHELHHSHMRAGHFRRLQSGKVTFIRPTIVRPDLPSRS